MPNAVRFRTACDDVRPGGAARHPRRARRALYAGLGAALLLLGGVPLTPSVAADNGTLPTPYWARRGKTTEIGGGTAYFVNDCERGDRMYVTIQKSFGPVNFMVDPKKKYATKVERGDQFSARCGLVVARDAHYRWVEVTDE